MLLEQFLDKNRKNRCYQFGELSYLSYILFHGSKIEKMSLLHIDCKFFKLGQPRPLVYFLSFQADFITIFTPDQCEKCHVHTVYGTGIQTHDLWNVSLLP